MRPRQSFGSSNQDFRFLLNSFETFDFKGSPASRAKIFVAVSTQAMIQMFPQARIVAQLMLGHVQTSDASFSPHRLSGLTQYSPHIPSVLPFPIPSGRVEVLCCNPAHGSAGSLLLLLFFFGVVHSGFDFPPNFLGLTQRKKPFVKIAALLLNNLSSYSFFSFWKTETEYRLVGERERENERQKRRRKEGGDRDQEGGGECGQEGMWDPRVVIRASSARILSISGWSQAVHKTRSSSLLTQYPRTHNLPSHSGEEGSLYPPTRGLGKQRARP